MACGTPVITSNNSSIPEVAGNAAILIDPNHPEELCEAMKNVLQDKKLYNAMRERGLGRLRNSAGKNARRKH